MRHVKKGAPYLLPLLLLLSFLYFIFPGSTEPSHRSALNSLTSVEVVADGFRDVRGIAVSENDLVYLADREAGTVIRIEPDGTGTIVASLLDRPTGLAFDLNGRLLIVERGGGRLLRLEADGSLTLLASGMNEPRWIAIAEDGKIYLTARAVSSDGGWGGGGWSGGGWSGGGWGGDEDENEVVLQLSPAGGLSVFAGAFEDLRGILVHGETLYTVAEEFSGATDSGDDEDDGAVFQIPILPDGTAGEISRFTQDEIDEIDDPVGLARDRLGALYVSAEEIEIKTETGPETGHEEAVGKVAPDGTVSHFASNLNDPRGIALDQQGNLYLADGRRLLRFLAPQPPAVNVPLFTNQNSITITGTTEPNSRIDAFLNDSETPVTLLTADGSFSLVFDLTTNNQNLITVFTTAQNGNGLTSAPAEFNIVHDAIAPIIANLVPFSGAFLNNPSPQISAGFSDGGSGIDSSSAQVLLNGIDVTEQVQFTASGFTLSPSNPLPQGLYLLSVNVTDFAGNFASVSFNFTVDLTPPAITNLTPADGSTATASRPVISAQFSDGVSGINPASARILLDGQDLTGQASISASGFTLDLTNLFDLAAGPHSVTIFVSDLAGNHASASSTFTRSTPLQVAITSPVDGASVESGSLLVTGTVDAQGAEVGVSVNGFPAAVQANSFAVLVPVTIDTTSLTAAAATSVGATASHTIAITVTDTGRPSGLLHASPESGVAPLIVNFSLFGGPLPAQVELDADGDGLVDFSGTELQEQPFTYTQPGIYVATAIMTDDQGNQFTANAIVQVYDQAALDALLQSKWTGMKDALRQGDIADSVTYIAELSRSRYEEAFQVLQSRLSEIDQILTNVTFIEMRNNSAIYEASRTDANLEKSFEVRFAVDIDGVWKVESF